MRRIGSTNGGDITHAFQYISKNYKSGSLVLLKEH